jgi:ABC-2 type transport system ATP-binding protein
MNADGSSPVVDLSDVWVRRGGRQVIRGVTVSVPRGRVVGLIGPSGCGKTTLMRTIVGVQANVEGTIIVLGRRAGAASRLGQVGYMTQDASVYGDLTVSDNLAYFAALLRLGPDRVSDVLGSVHLDDMARVPVDELSGGQRARVSLAIALLADPPLLVLDEPTVGLDPALRAELWKEFERLADAGTAVIVSSHVMDEARRCDRLVLMRDGQILAVGSPTELMNRTGTGDVEAAFLHLVAERGDS